jgi:hypothetical protein
LSAPANWRAGRKTPRNGSPPITVSGWGIWPAANPSRCAKWPSFSCAKPPPSRIVPRLWSRTGISGITCFHFGDFARKSVELYDWTRHGDFANRFGQDPHAAAEVFDALALWVLGKVDQALRLADRALADAGSVAHAPTMGQVLELAAFLGLVRYNPETVATHSQASADIVSRYDLPAPWAGYATFFQGWAKWSDGAEESGLAEMRRGLAINRDQGLAWFLLSLEAALAEAEASAGETDAGLRRLDDALVELEEAAIAIAQSQKARSFELRAALSLAKLYRAANRDADTHAVLAPAVEGFPPTQQFPELTDAQALLSMLSTLRSIASVEPIALSAPLAYRPASRSYPKNRPSHLFRPNARSKTSNARRQARSKRPRRCRARRPPFGGAQRCRDNNGGAPLCGRENTGNFAYFAVGSRPNGEEYRKDNNALRENSRRPRTGKFRVSSGN